MLRNRVLSWILTVAILITCMPLAALGESEGTQTPDTPAAETATPEPATATPEPATATPEPATATPEPATATPEPATATPEPATATPEPATATPEPEETPAPATDTPEPTVSSTPSPTPTALPAPEAAPAIKALPAPTGLNAVSWSYRSVELTWNAVAGADYYTVQRGTSYAGPFTQIISSLTSTRYIDDSSVSCGTTYYYRVQAYDAGGNFSSFSDIVAVAVIPVVPRLLTAVSAGATSIKLTWEKGYGASGYYIYRSLTGAGSYTLVKTLNSGDTLTYTDTGLATGTAYSYRIQSYYRNPSTGALVASDYSNVLTAIPSPVAPTGLTAASASYNSIRLAWTAVAGATAYSIERTDAPNGAFTAIATVSTNGYTDTYVQTGTTYYYRVAATVNGAVSPFSATASCAALPVQVKGLTAASMSDTSVKLTWTTSVTSGYSGYVIEMYDPAVGAWSEVKTIPSADLPNTVVNGLTTGELYFFRIYGYTTVAGGRVLGVASAQVSCRPKPRIPVGFTIAVENTRTLAPTWNKVASATGYELYRSTSTAASSFTLVARIPDDGSSTYSYRNAGLTTGTRYYYRVIAYITDSQGVKVYSSYSSTLSAIPAPAVPTGLTLKTLAYNGASFRWNTVYGASGYELLTSGTLNGTFVTRAVIANGSSTTGSVTGLQTGVQAYAKIRAYCLVNGVKIYGELSAAVAFKPAPSTTVLTAQSLQLRRIKLSWKAVQGATGYALYVSQSAGGTYTRQQSIQNATSIQLTCTPGLTQYYKILPYCVVGTDTTYGEYSNEVEITPLPATTAIASVVSSGEGALKISWRQTADIANADGGYYLYRGTSKSLSGMVKIATLSRTDLLYYEDTALSLGNVYFYAIRSYVVTNYGVVISKPSAIASGYTLPAAPNGLTISQNRYNSLTLTWNNTALANSGFEIYYATALKGTYVKLGACSGAPGPVTYTTPGVLEYNRTYYFKVRATQTVGSTVVYSAFTAVVQGLTYLPAPASVTAKNADYGTIKVFWQGVTDAQGYHIYVSETPATGYELIKTVKASARVTGITTLSPGKTYYFKVAAYRTIASGDRDGAWSAVASVTCAPLAPSNLTATVAGYRSIKLKWTGVSGVTGYTVYRRAAGTGAYAIVADQISANATTITLNDQKTGVNYQYYITSYVIQSGRTVRSVASNVVQTRACVLAPAKATAAFISPNSIRVSWSKVANASGYMVQRATSASGPFSTLYTLGSGDTLSCFDDVSAVDVGTKLYYRVLGYYLDPDTLVKYAGYASKVASLTRPPMTPAGLTATRRNNTSVTLRWTLDSQASGYYVYRSTEQNTGYTQVARLGAVSSFIDYNLNHNARYYYRVRSYYVRGGKQVLSNQSATVSVVP